MVLLVLYGTLAPAEDIQALDLPTIEYMDKIVHIIMFLVLGFFIKPSYPQKSRGLLCVILVLYGLLIEILQENLPTGRSFELTDLLADFFGVIIGFIIYEVYKSKKSYS